MLLADMREAARLAGTMLLTQQPRARMIKQNYKDFVTEQDQTAEKIICDYLAAGHPDVAVFAEERGGEPRRMGRLWIIDPLDGTKNYFRQDDHWSVSIAYVEDGRTSAGVIFLPGKNLLLSTHRSFENSVRVEPDEQSEFRVSRQSDLKSARLWTDWSKGDQRVVLRAIEKLLGGEPPQIRNCCTAGMIAVAMGRVDGFFHVAPEPFDFAAAALIVEQKGGRVTDLDGNPWHPFSPSIAATNGLIHEELLTVLRS